MSKDDYHKYGTGNSHPAREALAIIPHDTDEFEKVARSLYVGVAGDITLYPVDGSESVLFSSVPVGILPISCNRVLAAGTTASNIVALW